jgi:hypothetical protein
VNAVIVHRLEIKKATPDVWLVEAPVDTGQAEAIRDRGDRVLPYAEGHLAFAAVNPSRFRLLYW